MKRASMFALVAAASVALATPAIAANPAEPSPRAITDKHVPDQVLVGFAPGSAASDRAASRSALGASAERLSPLATDAELWTLPPGRSVEDAIATLSKNPNIRFVEPNYILETTATANDPDYTSGGLWGMYGNATTPANQFGSQAGEAWAAGATGTAGTYVVVIDEGIQVAHPDLVGNMWTNPFDAVDGIDNDGNGFVDDVNGWDFDGNNRSVYDGTGDDHGTHVAGTIGAVGGNGIGVAGVNWDVTMISAKFLGTTGGTTANAVKAVDYATDLKTRHGLNIVATSNSWGGGGYSQALVDAIARGGAQNILFVAAAGNNSNNNDAIASYPSNYNCRAGASTFDCVVAVAAIDSAGGIASFSQYGATTVDLGAPGVNVRSTLPSNTYGNYSGTSMATPHVSGAVALCSSMNGGLRGAALKDALMTSTAATSSLSGKTVTGGRLDMGAMAAKCGSATPPPPAAAPTIASFAPSEGYRGSSVVVTGTGLSGATATVNGVAAAVTASSATSLTLTVPSTATSGRIVVTNSGGPATSATDFTVLAAAAPTAPTGVSATSPSNGRATVRWALSSNNGGSAITSQTVVAYRVSNGTSTRYTVSPTATSLTISNLTRRVQYQFAVIASNTAGSSPESTRSAAVTIR